MAVSLIDYALRGNLRSVKRCVYSGVDVDACERAGNSALYHAVVRNRQKCVKFLLQHGADPNRINKEGFTPVNAACLNNNVQCLALLVQHGGSLEKLSTLHKESAVDSAYKTHQYKLIKFINEAITDDGLDLLESASDDKLQEGSDQQIATLPELAAVVPQITADQLKAPQMKLLDDLPHMTLQRALWHFTPVTVKHIKGLEGRRQLLIKEADLLSWLRHPRVTLLMAVCMDPNPKNACLVLEHFHLATLNHLLYKSKTEMNLPRRVHILLDVAEGMAFLHNRSIVHGFLNSFSVLINEKFRAKIGCLEYSQDNGEQKYDNACSIHENWMAPEQLLHQPPNMTGDTYSFGALMWETLARTVPWSWLQQSTVTQALCVDHRSLPMLEIWPNYVQSIMKECLQDPADRPAFCIIHGYLLDIRNKGQDLTSEVLDGAFTYWQEVQDGIIYSEIPLGSGEPTAGRSSNIEVMLRRSQSGAQWSGRSRSQTVKGGLKDILKVMSNRAQDSPREKEIERFGYEIAERLAFVRNIRRHARNYERTGWAKEAVSTRLLEGDIERIRKEKEKGKMSNATRQKLNKHRRRYSIFDEEGFEKLQNISSKYKKKDWSKIVHGMEKLKNSMEGFKGQVFEELNRHEYERKQLTNSYSVPGPSIRHGDLVEAIERKEENFERACSQPDDKQIYKYKCDKHNLSGMSEKSSEMLDVPHSKGQPLPIYAQPNKKNRISANYTKQKLGTQGKDSASEGEKVSDKKKGTKFQIEKNKASKQETAAPVLVGGNDIAMLREKLRKLPMETSSSGSKVDTTAAVRVELDSYKYKTDSKQKLSSNKGIPVNGSEMLQLPHSKGQPLPIYAQPDKKKTKCIRKELGTQGKDSVSEREKEKASKQKTTGGVLVVLAGEENLTMLRKQLKKVSMETSSSDCKNGTTDADGVEAGSYKCKTDNKQKLPSRKGIPDKSSEILELPHSKGEPLPIYAQPDKKPKYIEQKFGTQGNDRVSGSEMDKASQQATTGPVLEGGENLTMLRKQLNEVPMETSSSDCKDDVTAADRVEADSSNQEKSKMSDSNIHGSSSHGLFAISDFLRETDSFRKERSESIALRSQNNSIVSAIVPGSNGERIESRLRSHSAGQPRCKPRSRSVLSDKEGTSKDQTIPYIGSSRNVRFDKSQGRRTSSLLSNYEDARDIIESSSQEIKLVESQSKTTANKSTVTNSRQELVHMKPPRTLE